MIAAAFVHFEQEVPLYRQVRELVSMSLSEGIPVLFDVARAFRMSRRTLQRRLAERGLSYQTLVGEARRQLTMRLLQQTNFGLIEVAFMTGLSGQSAFKGGPGGRPAPSASLLNPRNPPLEVAAQGSTSEGIRPGRRGLSGRT